MSEKVHYKIIAPLSAFALIFVYHVAGAQGQSISFGPEIIAAGSTGDFHFRIPVSPGLAVSKTDKSTAPNSPVPVSMSEVGNQVEAVLLLDVSGSMDRELPTTSASYEPAMIRWDDAQEAATQFLILLYAFAGGQSDFGIVLFPDLAEDDSSTGSEVLVNMRPITDDAIDFARDQLDDTLDRIRSGPRTPVGHSLARVVGSSKLGLSGFFSGRLENRRIIALLSDGAHNQPEGKAFPHPRDFYQALKDHNIHVYTVGYDEPGGVEVDWDLLTEISSESGVTGMPKDANVEDYSDLRKDLRDIVVTALQLDHASGGETTITSEETKTHQVIIDAADTGVAFLLDWATFSSRHLRFELVTPDSEIITPTVARTDRDIEYYSGERYAIYTIKGKYLEDPQKWGPWQLSIQGKRVTPGSREPYRYDVITRSSLKMIPMLEKSRYFSGDAILLKVALNERGKALTNASVTCRVTKPAAAISNWLATHLVTREELLAVPDMLGGEYATDLIKKAYILNTIKNISPPTAVQQLDYELYDDGTHGDEAAGDGIYTNIFKETEFPGNYEFSIQANGSTSAGNPFVREQPVELYVGSLPDPDSTEIFTAYDREFRDDRWFDIVELTMIPRDRFGNYIVGGDLPIDFVYNSTLVNPIGDVINLFDGSYAQVFKYSSDITEYPKISIQVKGIELPSQEFATPGSLEYVNEVVQFTRGAEAIIGANRYANPQNALGPLDLKEQETFLALGAGGSATFSIKDKNFMDGAGNDFTVFTVFDPSSGRTPEAYKVEVLPVGSKEFVDMGTSTIGSKSFDLTKKGIKEATNIRIIDLSGHTVTVEGEVHHSPGVDVSAIGFRYVKPRISLPGLFSLSYFVGWFSFDNDLALDDQIPFGTRVGFPLSEKFQIEAEFGLTLTDDSTGAHGHIFQVGGNLMYDLLSRSDRRIWPFLTIGAGFLRFNDFSDSDTAFAVNFGGGVKYTLSKRLDLRLDVRDYVVSSNTFTSSTTHNLQTTAGVLFWF